MFFVAGGRLAAFRATRPGRLAAASPWRVMQRSYQMDRVKAFIDPWADAQGIGHQTVQGLLALGTGGVTGIGLGQSRQPGALRPAAGAERLRLRAARARSSASSAPSP